MSNIKEKRKRDGSTGSPLDGLVAKLVWREEKLDKPNEEIALKRLSKQEEASVTLRRSLMPLYEFITDEQLKFLDIIPDDLDINERIEVIEYLLRNMDGFYDWYETKTKILELRKERHAGQRIDKFVH
ncbi:MAG: hypothetical protein ACM3SR_19050 [Ignavibacteriales bacterium]